MKKMNRYALWMAVLLSAGLAACGSSGSGTSDNGLNNATSVTGTCKSASGDPVPGATIYVPGTTVSTSESKATRAFGKVTPASDGTTCEDPPSADQSLASACTGQDGTFTIDTASVTGDVGQIVYLKGSLRMVQTLNCTSAACAIPAAESTFGGGTTTWPTVAVVTGTWDEMEAVLAKLADSNTADGTNGQYGRVDADGTVTGSAGRFVFGSEYGTRMTVIDGRAGVTTPYENASAVSYNTWDKYLDGTYPLVSNGSPVFDVIFINCGNSYDTATYLDTAAKTRLQDYVNAGGRLYVTDLAYDFVEQPFPQVMKFEGDSDSATTPGDFGDAQTGTRGVTVNAAVNSAPISSWLGGVGVNRHDASTPGNPSVDCSYSATYDQIASALTSGGLIPLGDFLSGWAQMVSAHTGYSPTVWISSGTGVTFDGLANRPLTVSMGIGSNSGRVIFSSYHTAHSCPSIQFWPQERVLQYLIFESF